MDSNEMSALPWSVRVFDDSEHVHIAIMCPTHGVATLNYNSIVAPVSLADANAITAAVNATYGNGINPGSVKDLRDALKTLVEYFEWLIEDPKFPAYRSAKDALEKAK